LGQILQCQFEKQRFAGLASQQLLVDGIIIDIRIADSVFENGGIGSQTRYGKLVDIMLQRAAG
jgi:hypothetical protein